MELKIVGLVSFIIILIAISISLESSLAEEVLNEIIYVSFHFLSIVSCGFKIVFKLISLLVIPFTNTNINEAFDNKVVLITGASSGIGEHLVYQTCQKHAHVILAARRVDKLANVQKQCQGAASTLVLKYDASKMEDAEYVINEITKKYGKLDYLILNAGIGGPWSRFDNITNIQDAFQVIEINLKGYINMVHTSLPLMKKTSGGRIVAVSSFYDQLIAPYQSIYASAKHGLRGFFDTLRQELHEFDISVTVHSPGGILTEVQSKFTDGSSKKQMKLETPSFFLASAEGCAKSILYAAAQRNYDAYFPWYANIVCYMRRLFPYEMDWGYQQMINNYLASDIMKIEVEKN